MLERSRTVSPETHRANEHPSRPAPDAPRARSRIRLAPLTVALLDDDAASRRELAALLARQRNLCVIGEAGRLAELLQLMEATPPDIVVLDVLLRYDGGLDVIRHLRHLYPDVKVVVVTNQLDQTLLLAALRAGAHGYLDRMDGARAIAAALRLVGHGERVLPDQRAVTHVVGELERLARADSQLRIGLTAEERELLAQLVQGRSNQEIATRIGCSLATVKRHLALLFGKLRARDRDGAISEALRQGVL